MGLLLIPVFIIYLLLALIGIIVAIKFSRSKIIVFGVVLFFIVFPFRRFIFYHTLFWYYSRSPLQEIHETVEYPISVYWEDNVWPGFDDYGRHWMVKNYLDGEHLKLLALNGDDGKIYLYRVVPKTFSESDKLYPRYLKVKQAIDAVRNEAIAVGSSGGDNTAMWKKIREREDVFRKGLSRQYEEQREKEISGILDHVEVYNGKSALPPIRYHVEFNLLPKSFLLNSRNKILHADRISIVDMESAKEIAFSTRFMAYSWTRYFGAPAAFGYYKLGDIHPYELDDKVLFGYGRVSSSYESKRSSLNH